MGEESCLSREDLLMCVELGKALTSELDPDLFLSAILGRISEVVPARNWSMLLLDEASNTLRFAVTVGIPFAAVKDLRFDSGQGIAGQAILQKKTIVVEDVTSCPFFDPRADDLSGFKTQSLICVPLIFGGEVVGVGEVVNPEDVSERTIALMEIIAEYSAIAVVNTRRYLQIRDMADREHVTGLYNTRYLYRFLQDNLKSATPLSLLFLDMDSFKKVVDTHGHLHGTRALQEVAKTLNDSITEPSFAVSYGGDEFVVVLPGYDKAAGHEKAEEIRSRMNSTAYLADQGLSVNLTASFGLATCPDDAQDAVTLLAYADNAMFGAKYRGKNCVE